MYAIIIEWGDGSVDANGPYESEHQVVIALGAIVTDLARDEDREAHWHDQSEDATEHGATIGQDGEDTIDVYIREMGTPVETATQSSEPVVERKPGEGCPVCGDPTGIRCCEHGADR